MPILTPFDLMLPYQKEFADDEARFKIGLWPRQIGKDFTESGEAVRDCYRNPRTEWTIAAPSERQSLMTLDKCKDWVEACELSIEDLIIERDNPQALLKSATIVLPNRSRINAIPGKPDTCRGLSSNTVLTEFAFFDDPDGTWRALYPSITNPLRGGKKKIRIISTPNGKTGRGARFFKLVESAEHPKPNAKMLWSLHRMTIYDAVAQGLPIDIEELREGLDDEIGWRQEYLCEFLDGSNVLLPYDLLALAEDWGCSTTIDAEFFLNPGSRRLYCGVDFGRTNDPSVCWTWEKVGPILFTREVLVLDKMDTPSQQEILRMRIAAAERTCLDYTGPGIGLGDYLVKEHKEYKPEEHKFGKVQLCTFTQKFKSTLFPRFRQRFVAPTTVRVPVDIEVREDLHAMQQIISNGQYSYQAPRTADGHSDRCTAAALGVLAAEDEAATCDYEEAGSSGRVSRGRGMAV
jgi:phage FluMu gp28-like protein